MTALQDLIQTRVPLRTGASAVYPHKHLLEKQFRFTSRFGDEVLLHRVVGDEIHLPRALCPVGHLDERTRGLKVKFPNMPKPRPEQVSVFADMLGFLKKEQSGIVQAYTGWGKTVAGYYAAANLGVKTLVITTKDDIYGQWIEGACGINGKPNFLGLTRPQVGEIRGSKVRVKDCPFVVSMIHTLCKDGKVPFDQLFEFGLVIFDECHRVPADSFSTVVDMLPALWRLGFSARPERADGKEKLLAAHIGPTRAKTEEQLRIPKVLQYTSQWQCPRVIQTKVDKVTGERVSKVVRLPHEPGKTAHIEKIVAADPQRNLLLAELILSCWEKQRKLVVFSTQIEHLNAMFRACRKIGISAKEMGVYGQATTIAEREARELVKIKPIIFTTYTMMGEGTSIDWLDTCLLAMPRSQVEQPVGRIRREMEGKKGPVVIDVVDEDSPVFMGYATNREHWYKSIGCVVKDMTGQEG